jgi:hypothetical protein
MSQLFDLNVQNYSLNELLDFFGLATNDDAAAIARKCSALKQKINKDPKLGPVTRGKMHDFLNRAMNRLSDSRQATTELFASASARTSANANDNRDRDRDTVVPLPSDFMQLRNDVTQHGDEFIITRPSVKAGIKANFNNGNSVLRGAPPGIINPMSVSTIKRALNVDTRFRSNYYTTKSTDFVFTIPYKFENVTMMSMANFELPLTYYAVSQQYENNCIMFQWESAPELDYTKPPKYDRQYTLFIPDGNDRSSFQSGGGALIESTINGILVGTEIVANTGLSFTANATSGRSIFACNSAVDASGNAIPSTPYRGAMRIVFNVKASIDRTAASATDVSATQVDTRPLPYFMGWQLGFRTAMYELRGGLDASGNFTVPQAAVSEGICFISGPRYLFLCIDDYNHNGNNYYAAAFQTSTIAPNIIARLNINQQINMAGAYGLTGGESLSTSLCRSREYFGPVNIERLRVTLVDDLGRVIDLNNMDWSFSLMFECVYSASSA